MATLRLKENLVLVSITVVGTIGIDTIITPFGQAEDILGGSAIYFALAAAHFQPVNIVAVAGDDLDGNRLDAGTSPQHRSRRIERATGATFRWGGQYHLDFNTRDTLYTELGVLATFQPKVPEQYRAAEILFLRQLTTNRASISLCPSACCPVESLGHDEFLD